MRFLRLDLGSDIGSVDFHPLITVVQGLDKSEREGLLDAIRLLVGGGTPTTGGLIEMDGELIELTKDEPIDSAPLTTLDVVAKVDEVKSCAVELISLQAHLDQVQRQADIDAATVEEIRAHLEPGASALVAELTQKLGVLRGEAEKQTDELADLVSESLQEIGEINPVISETPEGVAEVVEAWRNYIAERSEAKDRIEKLEFQKRRGLAAVNKAKRALLAAESEAVPITLRAEEEARLEELHFLETAAKRSRRKNRMSSEEEAEHKALLRRVGVDSWTAYTMYRLSPKASPGRLRAVRDAQSALDQCEHEFDHAKAELQDDPLVMGLETQLKEIKMYAHAHLGSVLPEDIGAALEPLVVQRDNPEFVERLTEVVGHLIEAGVDVPEWIEGTKVLTWIQEWLDDRIAVQIEGQQNEEALVGELTTASLRLEHHQVSMGRIERAEKLAAKSYRQLSELIAELESKKANDFNRVDQILLASKSISELTRHDAGTSVSTILLEDFDGMTQSEIEATFNQLEALAETSQIIVVSDNVDAISWATEAGLERVLVNTKETHSQQ